MAFVQWDKRMSIGVDAIDAQHKQLLAMMNRLHEACSGDACDLETVRQAADEFSDYTHRHFRDEEQFMDSVGYPGFDEHVEQHMEGRMKAVDFYGDYLSGGTDVGRDMLEFLKDWLINHILKTDRKLGHYLMNQDAK